MPRPTGRTRRELARTLAQHQNAVLDRLPEAPQAAPEPEVIVAGPVTPLWAARWETPPALAALMSSSPEAPPPPPSPPPTPGFYRRADPQVPTPPPPPAALGPETLVLLRLTEGVMAAARDGRDALNVLDFLDELEEAARRILAFRPGAEP